MTNKLYYFYSPHCSPCKQLGPIIDKLNGEGADIDKIDTNTDDGYAMALKFDLMQTPSVVIEDNNTKKFSVLQGMQTENLIKEYVK